MSSKTEEHFAREAERLLNDAVLADAMTNVRTKALVALATVLPTDTDEIRRLQAIAGCLQDVRDELAGMILAAGRGDGGFNPNERPETSTAAN